jgi:hypothetical protein
MKNFSKKEIILRNIIERRGKLSFIKQKGNNMASKEEIRNNSRLNSTPKAISKNNNNNCNGLNLLRMDYDRNIDVSMGILIVNYNNLNYTKNCIDGLLKQINKNFKIYLYDQNSIEPNTGKYLNECEAMGITVIRNTSNVPLNHLWNNFKNICSLKYLCFLNNDIELSNMFVDDTIMILETNNEVGVVIHSTNMLNNVMSENTLRYSILNPPYYQGWDFTLRRELMPELNPNMLIFGGDDYIFAKIVNSGYKIALAYSSPIIHFKEKTRVMISDIRAIQTNDAKIFFESLKNENLQQIDCTINSPHCNKFPPQGIKLLQNKKCVYTAMIGDYDNIVPCASGKKEGWDYICFTDNKNIKSDFWRVVYVENLIVDEIKNIKLARQIKTSFYSYLSSYEYILWIDARITISMDIDEYLVRLNDNDILFMKHPDANSILEELERMLPGKIETVEMCKKIKTRYESFGYKYDNGLIASGAMLIRNNERTIKFFKEWWNEINNFSHRDQLSANFVLWRNPELKYEIVDGYYNNSRVERTMFTQLRRKTKPFRYE